MSKSSRDYWIEREQEAIKHQIKSDKQMSRKLKRMYSRMLREVNDEIRLFYERYATSQKLTMQEAEREIDQLDIIEYQDKAKKYVRDKNFSSKANREMRLYNATMRINRLEMLKMRIELIMDNEFLDYERDFTDKLNKTAYDEYKRQAGILGQTIVDNEKAIERIVNASYHNAHFSDRIWLHRDMLLAELDILLKQSIINGKHPNVLARELREKFDASKTNSETLMRTETARVQIAVQEQSYSDYGFNEYEYIAEPSACKRCGKLNGKVFKVRGMQAGVNSPPMHPNCRCSTAAYFDRDKLEKELESRGL